MTVDTTPGTEGVTQGGRCLGVADNPCTLVVALSVFFFIITSTLPALFSSVYAVVIEPKAELKLSECAAAPLSTANLTDE
jgi:hypothetical protein